ncbi:hypothetical protein [Microbacterium terricola]|uniref:Uncharacterized protein n=1 Tax=Microbacterium terricola TaxID=344163 RepID=A0ABM8DYK3_9MICO|nr:hypothetical protein [Microbacterium terricola]UYK38686.1 hypothetical protein OAU46_08155 [Microbacterium terricola]BDV30626.1 hypothetical protein Microterr_12860 [Microbacterium terricola]
MAERTSQRASLIVALAALIGGGLITLTAAAPASGNAEPPPGYVDRSTELTNLGVPLDEQEYYLEEEPQETGPALEPVQFTLIVEGDD